MHLLLIIFLCEAGIHKVVRVLEVVAHEADIGGVLGGHSGGGRAGMALRETALVPNLELDDRWRVDRSSVGRD